MLNLNTNYSDLILALYEGVFERPAWTRFLSRLREVSGAIYTTLTLRAFRDDAITPFYCGQQPPAELQELVDRKLKESDVLHGTQDGVIYTLDKILENDTEYMANYYRNILAEKGNFRFVQATEADGVQAWMSCAGNGNGIDIDELLILLSRHLSIALRAYSVLERQKFNSNIMAEAASRLQFGWIMVDEDGCITDQTHNTIELLSKSNVISCGYGRRLLIKGSFSRKDLLKVLKELSVNPDTPPRAVHLHHDPWVDILIAPIKIRYLTAKIRPVAIVYVNNDRWSNADRCDQLCELFGFSSGEAKVALSLARGMTIAEAAEKMGFTLETARTYSKGAYSKAGARNQAELVRTILTSVLSLS